MIAAGQCRVEGDLNLGGDSHDTITLDRAVPVAVEPAPDGFDQTSLLLMGAVARSLQIAGALETLLDKHLKPGSFESESEFPELTPALRGSVPLPRMMRVIVEHTARLVHAENAALYERKFLEFCENLQRLAQRNGGRYARAATNITYQDFVLAVLRTEQVLA